MAKDVIFHAKKVVGKHTYYNATLKNNKSGFKSQGSKNRKRNRSMRKSNQGTKAPKGSYIVKNHTTGNKFHITERQLERKYIACNGTIMGQTGCYVKK